VCSHGISHVGLGRLSKAQAFKELTESRKRIETWTGIAPVNFAYPYGHGKSMLGDPIQWVRETGYELGLSLRRGAVRESSDPFFLPRDHVEGNWSLRDLRYFLTK
jgi:peptidoglycan/xylan/chitin deacetylase (PgdA/CDA1 family)